MLYGSAYACRYETERRTGRWSGGLDPDPLALYHSAMNYTDDTTSGCPLLEWIQAANLLESRLEEDFAVIGLSLARYGVLEQLAGASGPLSLGELADRLSCVRSNITQLVDRLEGEGLVRRVADPADRRLVRAELTTTGRERQLAGAERLRGVQAAFEASLNDADRAALERLLRLSVEISKDKEIV